MTKRTYSIEANPPVPMSWAVYQGFVQNEWETLLRREPPATEGEIQSFLERNPCLIPGAFCIIGNRSGHYPYPSAVVAQAPLPSYHYRVPDFLWLAQNSEFEQPVLVEIEAPTKKWWTQAGPPTAELTQALNQIAEWKAWFCVPHNVQAFRAFYGLDQNALRGRTFRPAYALVYGRRKEANANPSLTMKRANIRPDDVVIMTYDRLSPDSNASEMFCVRKNGDAFTAISVPPTMTWRPSLARDRLVIQNKEAAIEANSYLNADRKRFLIERTRYWDDWAALEERGTINTDDSE